jgi:hypothetical protein
MTFSEFEVGKLSQFSAAHVSEPDVPDRLWSLYFAQSVSPLFLQRAQTLLPTLNGRISYALASQAWDKLWDWKTDVSSCSQEEIENPKHCMIFYYALHVILLYRHDSCLSYYKSKRISLEVFKDKYECLNLKKLYDKGKKNVKAKLVDYWEDLFKFRNVSILVAAIKIKPNQTDLVKVASLLAEGRIHSLGGGQSFAATRRCYIYNKEFKPCTTYKKKENAKRSYDDVGHYYNISRNKNIKLNNYCMENLNLLDDDDIPKDKFLKEKMFDPFYEDSDLNVDEMDIEMIRSNVSDDDDNKFESFDECFLNDFDYTE